MDFDRINDFMLLGDSFPDFPLLISSEPDANLLPLPESLSISQFDDRFSLAFSSPSSLDFAPYGHQHLDDLDLDSFAWPNCSINDSSSNSNAGDALDVLPLNCCDLPLPDEAIEGGSGALIAWDEKKQSVAEKRASMHGRTTAAGASSSRLSDVGFEEIRNYFYMPITEAAREMNVGLTVLKKRCRELGIARWPHRKMKSLKSLIHNVQVLGAGEESVREELKKLEEHKKLMEQNPEMQLTERTKRLRQACFKANYKKRRMLQHA